MTATPKDLQDEVGRLREALEDAKEALMDGSGAGVFWRESAVERINKALQTPPESAGEMLSKSNNAAMLPIDYKAQERVTLKACCLDADNLDRKNYIANGGLYCLVCGSRREVCPPNSPQEPQACEHDYSYVLSFDPNVALCVRCGRQRLDSAPNSPQEVE